MAVFASSWLVHAYSVKYRFLAFSSSYNIMADIDSWFKINYLRSIKNFQWIQEKTIRNEYKNKSI